MRKLLNAAVEELVQTSYADLTVRSVAARAGVSTTTAYTYFPSKNKLVAEIYLRLLRDAPAHVDINETAEARIRAQLRELVLLVADTPRLADACTTAIMADDIVVDDVRGQIAAEVSRRIASSLGPGHSPEIESTLHMLFSGAMMHARSTPGGYRGVSDKLDFAVTLVMKFVDDSILADVSKVKRQPISTRSL
jgi:TetR/AcrR family transcriptional regulator, cholesterol catabolism regulator